MNTKNVDLNGLATSPCAPTLDQAPEILDPAARSRETRPGFRVVIGLSCLKHCQETDSINTLTRWQMAHSVSSCLFALRRRARTPNLATAGGTGGFWWPAARRTEPGRLAPPALVRQVYGSKPSMQSWGPHFLLLLRAQRAVHSRQVDPRFCLSHHRR